MRFWLLLIAALFLAGCSSHRAPAPNARLSDSIMVIAGLNDQLQSWRGTPYRYGGMSRSGVDCCPATWSFLKPDRGKVVCTSAFMIPTINLFMRLPAVA